MYKFLQKYCYTSSSWYKNKKWEYSCRIVIPVYIKTLLWSTNNDLFCDNIAAICYPEQIRLILRAKLEGGSLIIVKNIFFISIHQGNVDYSSW